MAWRLLLEVDVDGADEVGEDAVLAALARAARRCWPGWRSLTRAAGATRRR
jgi:hypothetical protein